jgi:hypothetical protein
VFDCLLLHASLSVFAVGFVFTTEQVKIQGDSGGRMYNLGGGSVGRCEGKNSYEHVSSAEFLPRWSCLNLKYKSFVNGKRNYLLSLVFNLNLMFK